MVIFVLVARVGGHVGQQRAHRMLKVAAGVVEIAIDASADPGGERGAKAAGLFNLRQLDAQAADVRQHLHPDVRVRRAAGDAQGLHAGKAFAHAVEVGHVAEHHALINRLQQMRAGVERLHAIEAAGHLQPGVAAVEKRQKKEVATGLWQAGDGLIDVVKREFTPLGSEPFEVARRGGAGFVNDTARR